MTRIAAALEQKEHSQALELSDQYLSAHPNDFRAGILKARALSGLHRHREADQLFERLAFQADGFPDDEAALRAWSTSLLHLQRWTRAISVLENLAETNPADPDIIYSLTAARMRAKQYVAALESAQRLSALPDHADKADVMIGKIHSDLGNGRLALEAWQRVLERNPDAEKLTIPAGEFLTWVGEQMLLLGKPQQAAVILERAMAKRPTGGGWALLGNAYAQTERPRKADDAWRRAVRLDPLNSAARGELADAAILAGDAQQALDWLRPLMTTGSLSSRSAYLLQRVYTRLDQPDVAAQWKERAQKLRKIEDVNNTIDELLRRSTKPLSVGIINAYQLAMQENWEEAEALVSQLQRLYPGDSLLQEIAAAVRKRGPLPDVSRLVGRQY